VTGFDLTGFYAGSKKPLTPFRKLKDLFTSYSGPSVFSELKSSHFVSGIIMKLLPLAIVVALGAVYSTPAAAQFGPDTCRQGYVWRETIPSDHVCVTPSSRTTASQENAQAPSRRNPTGPSGSNSCISGYVWREAFAGDRVCVTPARRAAVALENRLGPTRRAPKVIVPPPAPKPFGPDTCRQGFVWREAIPADHVCVAPSSRRLALQENAAAASRRNPTGPYGSDSCKAGFVWREAFSGDRVCVVPARRAAVAQENRDGPSRRQR
jgi:hypothetical protein